MATSTQKLADIGVSIWLDDLSQDRLTSGSLAALIATHNVVGVTSNPTIFAGAVAASDSYSAKIQEMKLSGASAEDAVFEIMISDVQGACDLLKPVFEATGGKDGRVSLEVSPLLAADTQGTIEQAKELWERVNRPNLMIKIPATLEGLPAITEVIGAGISVNVTLIFSIERYNQVIDAYFAGLSKAQAAGHDLSTIFSVASFFVSRVDTAIDPLLDARGTPKAQTLRSRAAIANARLAYELFLSRHQDEVAGGLLAAGANRQRPLWASTGVKDPALPQALYVSELAVADVVNTMPEKTLLATQDEGTIDGDRVTGFHADAASVMAGLADQGIDMAAVTHDLEIDGVAKFVQSWHDLLATIAHAMNEA
jgi:transaldolase